MKTSNGRVEGVKSVKNAVNKCFAEKFMEQHISRPGLYSMEFMELSEVDRLKLEDKFL